MIGEKRLFFRQTFPSMQHSYKFSEYCALDTQTCFRKEIIYLVLSKKRSLFTALYIDSSEVQESIKSCLIVNFDHELRDIPKYYAANNFLQ